MNEQILEKLKVEKNPSLQIVADFLKDHCEKEPAFADKVLSEKKTIEECWEYIKSRAKKQAENGCACITNDEVFGWALHYFDEETLEDWKPAQAKVKTSGDIKPDNDDSDDDDETEEKPVKKSEPKPTPKVETKKPKGAVAEGQISLFD